ncbi:MAG: hypothetical protein AB1480_16865 [Nitrospirota bacterium]
MERKIIIVSEDEELRESFNRAFKTLLGIKVIKFNKSFDRKTDIILYYLNKSSKDFDGWFCGLFRKKSLNPLIVIGINNEGAFIRDNPVFRNHPYNHAYITIPFRLQQFMDILNKIKPVYDDDTRMFIVNDYCKNYEYSLVTHELKIINKDKEKTLNNFAIVRDFYKGAGNKNKVNFIDGIMKKIKENDDWLNIAIKAKQTLVNDVEKGKANG